MRLMALDYQHHELEVVLHVLVVAVAFGKSLQHLDQASQLTLNPQSSRVQGHYCIMEQDCDSPRFRGLPLGIAGVLLHGFVAIMIDPVGGYVYVIYLSIEDSHKVWQYICSIAEPSVLDFDSHEVLDLHGRKLNICGRFFRHTGFLGLR